MDYATKKLMVQNATNDMVNALSDTFSKEMTIAYLTGFIQSTILDNVEDQNELEKVVKHMLYVTSQYSKKVA